jgi:hypothetical protein
MQWFTACQFGFVAHIRQQGIAPRRHIHQVADVAIEVAIGAFLRAEGPMDV